MRTVSRIKSVICIFLIVLLFFAKSAEVTLGTECEGLEEIEETEEFEEETEDTEDATIEVTDIEISDHEDELNVGDIISLSVTVLPLDATDSTITYKSSDESIATVNSSGEVKGISKGNVIIYVSAGNVTKEISLTVKVATTAIKVNNDYLVLKVGNTFQLSTTVTPADANQSITYRSTDESVATVSSNGKVTAKKVGNTTIIVSNGDKSIAVSVIVNQSTTTTNSDNNVEQSEEVIKEYCDSVNALEVDKIDEDTLYYLYSTGKILEIVGDGYIIEIDGSQIVNYKNEFYTDIQLVRDETGISFNLNKGEYLCGGVRVYITEPNGKYLYLYNTSKEKYELIQTDSLELLELTTPGQYLITDQKFSISSFTIVYFVAFGIVALFIGIGVYIILKKKYWFW